MSQREILEEIKKLPVREQRELVEAVMKLIGNKDIESGVEEYVSLEEAARLMKTEYEIDQELTAFTALDSEGFYEPR